MSGRVEVEQAAAAADHEEDVEGLEGRVWTTKSLAAQMAWAWLARKARQLLRARARPGEPDANEFALARLRNLKLIT